MPRPGQAPETSKTDDTDDPGSPSPKAAATARGPACPRGEPAGRGFTKWCCTDHGWRQQNKGSDCGLVYQPTEPCTTDGVGTTSTTACASKTRAR